MSMNSDLYGNREPNLDNFAHFSRFKVTYEKEILESKQSILDIGGADGEFIDLINRHIGPVDGSVIEIDAECIKNGRNKYPNISFVQKKFPIKTWALPIKKYDIVSMNFLFPHLLDWRKTILEMAKSSKKYIVFSALLRDDGPTIADDTISYVYYLDTGKRVAQVINNVWEIINFICLQEIRAKKIEFYGVKWFDDDKTSKVKEKMKESQEINKIDVDSIKFQFSDDAHVFRGIPAYDIIKGYFFIELFDEKDNPKRVGGLGRGREEQYAGYKFFRPEIHIEINNKFFFSHKDRVNRYNAKSFIKRLERF